MKTSRSLMRCVLAGLSLALFPAGCSTPGSVPSAPPRTAQIGASSPLTPTGITAGSYICPTVTVDKYGRILTAVNGSCSPGSGGLLIVNNLSDVASVPVSRQNLQIDQLTRQGDANYTIVPTDRMVTTNGNLTAARIDTLPAAASLNPGESIYVLDGAGGVSSVDTLTIARPSTGSGSTDTIESALSQVVISGAHGGFRLTSDGSSNWTISAAIWPFAAPSNDFLTGWSPTSGFTAAQPAFANLAGSAGCGQLPALTGNVTSSGCATTIAAGVVTNAMLANQGVTFNGVTVNLGASGTLTFSSFTGAIGCGQLPTFTGDVTNSSCAMTLANTAVAAGTYSYPTVTVDTKGRITSISSNSPSGVSVTARDAGTLITPSPGLTNFTVGRQELPDIRTTATETINATSINKLVIFTTATSQIAATLTTSAFASGQAFCAINLDTVAPDGPVVLTPSSGTINNLASVTLWYGQAICPRFDGTNWDDPSNGIASFENGITAHATGGQPNAYQLTKQISRITTVANANDSVKLLPSVGGGLQIVINDTTTSAQLFGTSPDSINTAATGTGIALPGNDIAFCMETVAGTISCAIMSESAPGGGSTLFSALTSATNTTAAMLVGTGASLGPTGSGTVTANALSSGATGTTQSANDNSTKIATTAYVDRPTTFTSGSGTITLSGPRNIVECTAACTLVLPTPAAGMEQCVRNADNVTSVITFGALSGIQFEVQARTSYKAANTAIASAGAATDQACFVGKDSTHYDFASATGTWS